MTKENFEGLLESVREAGQILRGEISPSREFQVEVLNPNFSPKEGYALCVKTDDEKLLIPCKIYQTRYTASGYVRIIDEEGEAAVYPVDFFIRLDLPVEVESVLENLQIETV